MTITLSGEPKSTNNLYRSACKGGYSVTYLSQVGKVLKEQYHLEARSQWRKKPLEGDISVSIALYLGTKRRADIDNFNKLSLDALTGIVWKDDSQISEMHIKREYDKARPRIELTVKEL